MEGASNDLYTIGKKEKNKVRPITLSSCVGKVLERMINERLMWVAEREGWFDRYQNGFRRGKSCIDNLTRLTVDIHTSKQTNENLIVAFLDVKSAYDNVRTSILCDILKKKKCPSLIINYISVWMRDRVTKFILGDDKYETRIVNKGLPQGGVLSPSLYNIYTSEISRYVRKNIKMIQYADDIAVYTINPNVEEGKIGLEIAIKKIDKRLNKLGLELESTKTNLMVFNNRRDRDNKITIGIKGKRIGNVRSARFLGIVFDSKIAFNRQLTQVVEKTTKAINIMRYVCRVTWGMETNTALLIYKAYVRSILEYGLFVYYPKDEKGRERLEKIQNKGLRIAMGYRNSTPINVMTAEAKILKVEDRAGLLARNYWTRITSNNNKEIEAKMNRLDLIYR